MSHPDIDTEKNKQPDLKPSTQYFAQTLLAGFVVGGFISIIPLIFAATPSSFRFPTEVRLFGVAVIFLLPLWQSLVTSFLLAKRFPNGAPHGKAITIMALIDVLVSFVVMREGVICILMAIPIIFAAMGIGAWVGVLLGKRVHAYAADRNKIYSSFFPLALIASAALTHPAVFSAKVVDQVTIKAPPAYVWNYIVGYPINSNAPEYWLWRIGLPMPTQSTAAAAEVGAYRECRFTNDIVFKEKITAINPHKNLEFDIVEQPAHPEIIGHFQLDKGQLQLVDNHDGSTTLIATSWYRLFVNPAFYFNWWAEDIVREVHFRVMGHMKNLAEAEYNAKKHD